jgi:hypothetical protein
LDIKIRNKKETEKKEKPTLPAKPISPMTFPAKPGQADTHGRVNQPDVSRCQEHCYSPELERMLQGSSVQSSPGNNVHIQ